MHTRGEVPETPGYSPNLLEDKENKGRTDLYVHNLLYSNMREVQLILSGWFLLGKPHNLSVQFRDLL